MNGEDYTVALDIYRGPMELLLHLIQENELDIYDIPIAVILGQYLDRLESLKEIDLNLAGDFLVMASRLMEIKSKMLIPREEVPEEGEEEDPRADLVRRLLEYKRYKLLTSRLVGLEEERRRRFGRPEYRLPDADVQEKKIEFELFDVTRAYERIMRETLAGREFRIVYDDVPVEDRMRLILKVLEERPGLLFLSLFGSAPSREMVTSTFLAMLELVKRRDLKVWQAEDFGEIRVALIDQSLEEGPPAPEEKAPERARRRQAAPERREEDDEEAELTRRAEEVLAFADEIMARYAQRRKPRAPAPPPRKEVGKDPEPPR